MFNTFSASLLDNKLGKFWPRIACLNQRVMDACLASMKQDGKVVDVEL